MRADKADIYKFYCEFYHYDQAIRVVFYVEHIMLVPDVVNTVERGFYIGETFPFTFLYNRNPFLQSNS